MMSESYDFRQIQRRTFQLASFDDGFWDLLLGSIILFLAIYPITRELLGPVWNLVLFLGSLAVMVVLYFIARSQVSEPRVGYVRPRRTPELRILGIFTVVLVLLTLGMVVWTMLAPELGATSGLPAEASSGRSYVVELITLLVLGVLFSVIGYLSGVTRLYFYGWMLGLAYLISVYMVHNAGWVFLLPLAIAAGIILLVGFVLLGRFLRKYPLREQGA